MENVNVLDVETGGTWNVGVWNVVAAPEGIDVAAPEGVDIAAGPEAAGPEEGADVVADPEEGGDVAVEHEADGWTTQSFGTFPTSLVCLGACLRWATHRHESLVGQCRVQRCGICPRCPERPESRMYIRTPEYCPLGPQTF